MASPADYNTMENDREALMKLFHLSDLHIGKRVNEFSMIEDQKYILSQILHAAKRERPDGVLLSGDIYDSTIPSAEAVQVFDAFLTELSTNRIPTFIISGNHDSAERLAFGSSLMGKSGIYFSKVYNGTIEKIPLQDFALRDADGNAHMLSALTKEEAAVLAFLGTGEEPTEHVLNELLDCASRWNERGHRLLAVLRSPEELENRTLRKVLDNVSGIQVYAAGREDMERTAESMGVDSEKLPVLVIVGNGPAGIYACAGYHVGSVELMLGIAGQYEK